MPQAVGLESHTYLRALPVALYLLFPYDEGRLGLEAIGNKQMHRGLKLLKQKPVVPAIGDLPLSLTLILQQTSPFLVAHGMSSTQSMLRCVTHGSVNRRRQAALYAWQDAVNIDIVGALYQTVFVTTGGHSIMENCSFMHSAKTAVLVADQAL